MEWTQTAQAITEIVAILIAAGGFVAIIWQLRRLDTEIRSSTRTGIYDMAARLKEVFVNHPHLRGYFYDGDEIEEDSPDYPEAVAVADYFCLYLEQIATQHKNILPRDQKAWFEYGRSIYTGSPIIQQYLEDNKEWYSEPLWKMVKGDFDALLKRRPFPFGRRRRQSTKDTLRGRKQIHRAKSPAPGTPPSEIQVAAHEDAGGDVQRRQ